MRVILVMTVRTFDTKTAYDEWDALRSNQAGFISRLAQYTGFQDVKPKLVNGERAYQTEKAGTNAIDGYPCRVILVA